MIGVHAPESHSHRAGIRFAGQQQAQFARLKLPATVHEFGAAVQPRIEAALVRAASRHESDFLERTNGGGLPPGADQSLRKTVAACGAALPGVQLGDAGTVGRGQTGHVAADVAHLVQPPLLLGPQPGVWAALATGS